MYGWWYSVMDTFISYSLTLHWSVLYSVQLILHKELMLNLWREGLLNKDTFCTEQFLPSQLMKWSHLKDAASHRSTTSRSASLLPVEIVLTGGLWQTLSGHKVHHRRLARGQAQCWQRHVPMKKSTLVYQPEDLGFRDLEWETRLEVGGRRVTAWSHRLLLPLWRPVVKHELSDITSALTRTKQILLGLPANQNQS